MRDNELSKLLARSFVLGVLGAEELARLASSGTRQRHPAGTELFRAGDPGTELLVILRGLVRIWRVAPEGQALTLCRCGAGELLGQMSALEEGTHSVNATVLEDAEVLRLSARSFREALLRRPPAALRLAQALAERVRSLSDELEAIKYSSISVRVLRHLQHLATSRRELRITHQAIAERVGATRENVTRVLGRLRDQRVISLRRGAIEILDHPRLAELVEI